MQKLYVEIYRLPIGVTVALVAGLSVIWYCLCRWYRGSAQWKQTLAKLGAAAGLFLWLAVVLHMTIFSRSSGTQEAHGELFYQLKMYFNGGPKELLRTLWMNVLLFVPGGLLLAALWPDKWPRWVSIPLTVLALLALSVGVETMQYRYGLGCAEADDVLCNTLGAMLGAGIHAISLQLGKRNGRH